MASSRYVPTYDAEGYVQLVQFLDHVDGVPYTPAEEEMLAELYGGPYAYGMRS